MLKLNMSKPARTVRFLEPVLRVLGGVLDYQCVKFYYVVHNDRIIPPDISDRVEACIDILHIYDVDIVDMDIALMKYLHYKISNMSYYDPDTSQMLEAECYTDFSIPAITCRRKCRTVEEAINLSRTLESLC